MVRFKNRYLLVEIHSHDRGDVALSTASVALSTASTVLPTTSTVLPTASTALSKLSASTAASHIRASIETNFGHYAAAATQQSFSVKYCNPATGLVIVRAARDDLAMVWSSLTFLTDLPGVAGSRWTWRVVRVSGTIKSCQKAAIRYSHGRLKRLLELCDPKDREKIESLLSSSVKAIRAIEA